jgi:hypothetical protein
MEVLAQSDRGSHVGVAVLQQRGTLIVESMPR